MHTAVRPRRRPSASPQVRLPGVTVLVCLLASLIRGGAPAARPGRDERVEERARMVEGIRRYGVRDEAALAAVGAVPRHRFVRPEDADSAYRDTPLPIGFGQTISQPYMVAEMTRLLALTADSKVLEVGTGSGYQAAVLAEITPHVFSVEIVRPLADEARERLAALGYDTVRASEGDGYHGLPDEAPFDAIIVTCASGQVPPPLLKQLAPGGRMVIPVGGPFSIQQLMLISKNDDGTITSRSLMAVRFVPLTRARD